LRVHNLMEDIVIETVNDIFNAEEKDKQFGYCTCEQCRLDVVCFVLNRIPAEYIISSRGAAHLEANYIENLQKNADLVAMINEGIKKVSQTLRPHFEHDNSKKIEVPEGILYNFPTIVGRIFDGETFEPMKDIEIKLLHDDGSLVEMINPNWQNPYPVVEHTAGNFTFWPYPKQARREGTAKTFSFVLTVEDERYEELNHFFELEIVSNKAFIDSYGLKRSYRVNDLYLFKA